MPQVSDAAVQRRARPGSFVHYTAPSVDSLVSQITGNPTVAKRYADHFGVPAAEIARYFRENLRTVALKRPTAVTTYFVSKYGTIQSKSATLPVGALVFATKEGVLVLEAKCGNPLTKALPVSKPETKVMAMPETVGVPPEPEKTVIPPPEEAVPELVQIEEPMVAMATIEPLVIAQPEVSAPDILGFASAVVPALLGAVAVRGDSPSPPAVPEPSSLLALAGGSMWIAAAIRRKRG
jgi:hypothetical protein